MSESRKLAAIMAIDVVGYSRLMGEDEAGTARSVREHRDAARPIVASCAGRLVKTMGDGLLLEFPSVVAAVECAVSIQKLMIERNGEISDAKRILYRIGVNLGDVLIDGDDILGEGVNIAARLEAICEPGGVLISGTAYDHVRGKIDAEFVDLGEKELKNIARPVRVHAVRTGAECAALAPIVSAPGRQSPPRLSIVVLPFVNLGGGEEGDYFVDGVTESLTTDLSRLAGAFVIARNTAFTYKGKAVDLKRLGRDLNVRFVLEGSVQRGGQRIRVNVQLIEAESGAHLWAERFDKPVGDLFEMQDEIVARLADQIGAHIVAVEARRAARLSNPDWIDLYFQGRMWVNKGMTAETNAQARAYFERAAALDTNNPLALHGLAQVDVFGAVAFIADRPEERLAAAEAIMAKLLLLDPDNARFQFTMGMALAFSNRVTQGIAKYERALALDPNLAGAHGQIGLAKARIGRYNETEGHIREALRLSPRDTAAFGWMQFVGTAKLLMGEPEKAVEWLRRSIEINGAYGVSHMLLAAALAELGYLDEARSEARAAVAFAPYISVARYKAQMIHSEDPVLRKRREKIIDMLRVAGIPEG
jgi:TolB-like protein/tetratricopeptide (TPR) repeat protein